MIGILSVLTVILQTAGSVIPLEPEFEGPIENVTVPLGRDVKLSCRVRHLGNHKVAWIFLESSAILTVQTHVITRNPRISSSHEEHKTWNLHLSNIQETDSGKYCCQINTPVVKTQVGYLKVVVPPSIEDSLSSSDTIVREGNDVTLTCHANGSPQPRVTWKREDGGRMVLNRTHSTYEADGANLELTKISRLDMGTYLCIASNGIPPAISKRIQVNVDFPPMIWVPHQLVGSLIGIAVTLECHLEAHPAAIHFWTRDDGVVLHDQGRYKFEATKPTESKESKGNTLPSSYKTHMKLTIKYVMPKDFGTYRCVAKNPRGETDGQIKLYQIPSPTTPSTTTEETFEEPDHSEEDLTTESESPVTKKGRPTKTTKDNREFQMSSKQLERKKKNDSSGAEDLKRNSHTTLICLLAALLCLSSQ